MRKKLQFRNKKCGQDKTKRPLEVMKNETF